MTARESERHRLHLKLNRWEDSLPDTPPFKEERDKIARIRKQLNEAVRADFLASRGLDEDSVWSFGLDDGMTDAEREEHKRLNPKPPTQRQQRELDKKKREAEKQRVKLTQQDILDRCTKDGVVTVNINDMKNAFPKIIFQIDGNAFRTQIDNKEFEEFLRSNGLTFSLPDFVFIKLT